MTRIVPAFEFVGNAISLNFVYTVSPANALVVSADAFNVSDAIKLKANQ